jgi:hypothetical protein
LGNVFGFSIQQTNKCKPFGNTVEIVLIKTINATTAGILKLDAVDAVDALHPHLLKLDAVHPVPTKTGCSASSTY